MAKRIIPVLFLLILSFGLVSCGSTEAVEPTMDPNLLYTMAAQTVIAQLTESAAKNPPTPTPPKPTPRPPTNTPVPLPTSIPIETIAPLEGPTEVPVAGATKPKVFSGDHASYGYQHPADGITMGPGTKFMLIFGAVNDGATTWGTTYRWVFLGGTQLSGIDTVAIKKPVPPGQKSEMDLDARAPNEKGKYTTRWKLVNPAGQMLLEVYFSYKVE